MKDTNNTPLISTTKERCRTCYTCVRECPAKAIRIVDGQAEIIPKRCIACGNCVRVCSQKAKYVIDSTDIVKDLLHGESKVAAIVAPSFPVEFPEYSYKKFVGMLRKIGFDLVGEVAFGADIVAKEYKKLFESDDSGKRYIATSCPAIVAYVERYHPDLVGNLAPIVSPMVAMARVYRKLHGDDLKIVFIGPCIAKKAEVMSTNMPGELDAAITFLELRKLFAKLGIYPDPVNDSNFDGPWANTGGLFPIARGLLQTAEITEDLVRDEIIAVEGRGEFVEAFKEFESGHMDVKLLEVLACNGCIMGPGCTASTPMFSRRTQISNFVRQRLKSFNLEIWAKDIAGCADLDLSRKYASYDQRVKAPYSMDLAEILKKLGKYTPDDELNCGACGYETCREHAIAIYKGLAEGEMCLPYTIEQLHKTINELATSNEQLANTQEALMQSEKLASMGQLAAGIAHEVNNPLGVVLMYSHLLLDEHQENPKLKDDLSLITEQADRCKKIVAGLLNFARKNKVLLNPTDIHELVMKCSESVIIPENIEFDIIGELSDNIVYMDRDQFGQVITNLFSNAIAAMPDGGRLCVELVEEGDSVKVIVKDTGTGISKDNLGKIFEPFFTTKAIGEGTGLGLAVAYGIVKMHRGNIEVKSNDNVENGPTGTEFTVTLPRNNENEKPGLQS